MKIDKEKVRRLHEQGMTDKEIGEEMDYSRWYIGDIRAKLGLPANRANTFPDRRVNSEYREYREIAQIRERIKEAEAKLLYPGIVQHFMIKWQEGKTDSTIANECGCLPRSVTNWRKQMNLKSNQGKESCWNCWFNYHNYRGMACKDEMSEGVSMDEGCNYWKSKES